MLAAISIVLFVISFFLLNKKIKIFSKKISPLGLAILLSIFIQILPGIILVSLFDFPMSYGLHNSISQGVLYFTLWYTLLSLAILFFLLFFASYFINFNINFNDYYVSSRLAYAMILGASILMAIKIASVGDIPLVQAMTGQFELSGEQKAKILKGEVGLGGFLVGYIFSYFHYIAFIYAYIARHRKKISKTIFYMFVVIVFFYSVYDLQKYNVVFLVILSMFMYVNLNKFEFSKLLYSIFIVFFLLVLAFMLLHDSSISEVFQQVVSRMFIGQMEGSYMMYEALEPDINRIAYGAPLKFIFGTSLVTDPSADVVRLFFPSVSDAWVNSNSYILAHAWTIFGFIALFIMPIVLTLNIVLYAILRNVFKPYIGLLALIIYVILILKLQINNDFSYFLYFRAIVAFTFLAIFSFLVVSLVKYASNNKRRVI